MGMKWSTAEKTEEDSELSQWTKNMEREKVRGCFGEKGLKVFVQVCSHLGHQGMAVDVADVGLSLLSLPFISTAIHVLLRPTVFLLLTATFSSTAASVCYLHILICCHTSEE